MKIRHTTTSGDDKVEMQMTPMIDIVFQLLIFFVMSFKIVAQEGDFNIKMPAPSAAPPDAPPPQNVPILVRLQADPDGNLSGIFMGQNPLGSFGQLHEEVLTIVGTDMGPGSMADMTEVEIDADYNLDYRHVINAITAVSGYVGRDGVPVKLIDKIKFTPPKAPQ